MDGVSAKPASLPFSWTVKPRKLPMSRDNFDYPVRQAVIDGEVWVIYVQWGDHYKERGMPGCAAEGTGPRTSPAPAEWRV